MGQPVVHADNRIKQYLKVGAVGPGIKSSGSSSNIASDRSSHNTQLMDSPLCRLTPDQANRFTNILTNHFNITFQQTTDDISLYTAIHQYHFPFIRTFIIANHFLATYFIYIVNACISSFKNIVRFIVKNNLSQHHAMFAEYFSQLAGINACDAGNLLAFQPVTETFHSVPVAVFIRIVTYDNRFRMNLLTFHKSSESVRFD